LAKYKREIAWSVPETDWLVQVTELKFRPGMLLDEHWLAKLLQAKA
jgi:hypothetical protein